MFKVRRRTSVAVQEALVREGRANEGDFSPGTYVWYNPLQSLQSQPGKQWNDLISSSAVSGDRSTKNRPVPIKTHRHTRFQLTFSAS